MLMLVILIFMIIIWTMIHLQNNLNNILITLHILDFGDGIKISQHKKLTIKVFLFKINH